MGAVAAGDVGGIEKLCSGSIDLGDILQRATGIVAVVSAALPRVGDRRLKGPAGYRYRLPSCIRAQIIGTPFRHSREVNIVVRVDRDVPSQAPFGKQQHGQSGIQFHCKPN